MKNFNRKSMLVIACIVLVLTVTVGGTLAYLITSSGPVTNTFTPARVTCAVIENGKTSGNLTEYNVGTTKSDVVIKNTGTTAAYIRAAVAANWVDASNNIVAPVKGFTFTSESGWSESNGFYYYANPVDPDKTTSELITSYSVSNAGEKPANADHLEITVICQAIQSAGNAKSSEW